MRCLGTLLRLILLPLLLGGVLMSPLRAQTVAVLLSDSKGGNAEFGEALRGQLTRAIPGVTVKTTLSIEEAMAPDVRLIVGVGSVAQQSIAAQAARPARPPVLAALTPRSTFERIFERAAGRSSTTALFLDQPEERQLALLTLLPGNLQGVGVVSSAASALSLPRLRQAATKLRLKLVEVPVAAERDVAHAIQEAASQSEVLLAHPDPVVFNPQTIQNVLLTTYRAKVPVFGFSPAYTRAGALLSLYSSVPQLADQAAEMARQILAGSAPATQYPKHFEVAVNPQVARSLGIDLPPEQTLGERLRQRERAL